MGCMGTTEAAAAAAAAFNSMLPDYNGGNSSWHALQSHRERSQSVAMLPTLPCHQHDPIMWHGGE
jgi:hypothetical protein